MDTLAAQGMEDIAGTGITHVLLGIESASEQVLKMMNKKTKPEMIAAGCRKLKANDLNPVGLWMIGHPGDNPVESQKSLGMLEYLLQENLMTGAHVSIFAPCPGTDFFDHPEKYGIEMLTRDWSQWRQYEVRKPVCQLRDFSAAEMLASYSKACEIISRERPNGYWP